MSSRLSRFLTSEPPTPREEVEDIGDHYALRRELIPHLPYVDKHNADVGDVGAREPLSASLRHSAWLDLYHEDHCEIADHYSSPSPWHGPLWFIDGMRRCIVGAEPNMKYFALSYVWGACAGPEAAFALRESNLDELQQPNSLRITEDEPRLLPKLIDDVIEFVVRLGWRYIWIDRYCIVQDNGPAKDAQINAMNAIYSRAFATIVVADADNESGLKGLKGHSEPRGPSSIMDHITQSPFQTLADNVSGFKSGRGWRTIGSDWLRVFRDRIRGSQDDPSPEPVVSSRHSSAASYDSFDESFPTYVHNMVKLKRSRDRKFLEAQAYLLMRSPWYKRGWTFQESLFSRRKIVFQNDSVNWECHCVAWYEQQEVSSDDDDHGPCVRRPAFSMDAGFDATVWPDMYRYARLVCLFNMRQLTFPEDALYAFAGVTSSLSRTFQFGFVSGLPQMFFHSTLVWQPYRPIARRIAKAAEKPILPSWSWAGWQGVLQYESWRSGYSYVKSPAMEQNLSATTWRTFETVKWYRLDDDGQKHDIRSIEAAEASHNTYAGWTSSKSTDDNAAIYRHVDIPDTEFWHPVALRDPLKAHVPPIYCRCITSSTQRAAVKTGETFRDADSSQCTAIDLLDQQDQWIGVLRLPSDEAIHNTYEVIELSGGSVQKLEAERDAFDEWARPGFQKCWKNGVYEFVNVMAIAWKDGMPYREAVGRIEKSHWESLDKDIIDVVLG